MLLLYRDVQKRRLKQEPMESPAELCMVLRHFSAVRWNSITEHAVGKRGHATPHTGGCAGCEVQTSQASIQVTAVPGPSYCRQPHARAFSIQLLPRGVTELIFLLQLLSLGA